MVILLALLLILYFASALKELHCMNFYGLETDRAGLVCDWQHEPGWYLQKMKTDLNIDTIRLPFSYQYVIQKDFTKMDSFIGKCNELGLRVILDYHRTWSSHQGPTPEEGISMDQFISSWVDLLRRYEGSCVLGVGVFNEIQTNDFNYTMNMHRRVIAEIERNFPERFLYFVGCPGWGGNCSDMDLSDMPTWNRTYVEVHKYKFSGASNRQDWDISIPDKIPPDHWFVGEFGWKQDVAEDLKWAEGFISYLKERNIRSVCGWTIAHSGDTAGWWKDDCETFDIPKAQLLMTLWSQHRHYLRAVCAYGTT